MDCKIVKVCLYLDIRIQKWMAHLQHNVSVTQGEAWHKHHCWPCSINNSMMSEKPEGLNPRFLWGLWHSHCVYIIASNDTEVFGYMKISMYGYMKNEQSIDSLHTFHNRQSIYNQPMESIYSRHTDRIILYFIAHVRRTCWIAQVYTLSNTSHTFMWIYI